MSTTCPVVARWSHHVSRLCSLPVLLYPACPASCLHRTRQTFERLRKDGLWWGWERNLHGSPKPHIWRLPILLTCPLMYLPVKSVVTTRASPLASGWEWMMSHFFCKIAAAFQGQNSGA